MRSTHIFQIFFVLLKKKTWKRTATAELRSKSRSLTTRCTWCTKQSILEMRMQPSLYTLGVAFLISTLHPARTSATTQIEYNGKWYGLLSGRSATSTNAGTDAKYHADFFPVPAGCRLAGDSSGLRELIGRYPWSCNHVVLGGTNGNGKSINTRNYGGGSGRVGGQWLWPSSGFNNLQESGGKYKARLGHAQVMYECSTTTTATTTTTVTSTTTQTSTTTRSTTTTTRSTTTTTTATSTTTQSSTTTTTTTSRKC